MSSSLKKYFSPVFDKDEELCLLQIFKPLYILLSCLGLFPQPIKFPDGVHGTTVDPKNSIINSTCTLLMIILIHVFFVFHLQELNTSSKDNARTEDKMTLINYTVALVTGVFFCTVSFYRVICDRETFIAILNGVADCWDSLAMGKRRWILGQLRVQVNCVVIGSILLCFVLQLLSTYIGMHLSIWKKTLMFLTFYLPELMQFTMIAFYFVMILMIVALLRNIEEELRIVLHKKNNILNVEADLGIEFAEIMNAYVKTMELKRKVNAAFQAPILLALVSSFHDLVTVPHLMYHGLVFQSNFSTQDIMACSVWLFNQLVKIYVLARSGDLLKLQVNEIGRSIHSIPISGSLDWHVIQGVQHFSSLINYQDATITIYGYFPLDATLLFNIVASAAMYLVILVQFDTPV